MNLKKEQILNSVLHRKVRQDINYLFCISSGRSGSNYLCDLLDTADNGHAYHEPHPQMTHKYLEMVNNKSFEDSFAKRKTKVYGVNKMVTDFQQGEYYVETSHMFIKTFFDVVVDAFDNVQVVVLRRNLSNVLKSFIEMNYFTDKNNAWPHWMSSPHSKTRALEPLSEKKAMNQIELSIAYLLDIEARAQRFKKQFPHIQLVEVNLGNLNSIDYVKTFFKDLGLGYTKATEDLCGNVVNKRSGVKSTMNNPVTLDFCKEQIEQYIDKAKKKGIEIPDTILLE